MSRKEPPLALGQLALGYGQVDQAGVRAWKALSGQGHATGPGAAPCPLWASCFPLLH